jgi:hypothetical protein
MRKKTKMANICRSLRTKIFFSPVLKSPTHIGFTDVKKNGSKISHLGTFKLIQTGIEFRTRRIVRMGGGGGRGGNIVSRGIYFFKGDVYLKQSWVETGIVNRSIFDKLSSRQPQIQCRRTYDLISTASARLCCTAKA